MKKFIICLLTICVFMCVGCNENKSDDYTMSIVAPSGAPAVAIAELATTYADEYDITLGLAATALQPAFASGENDVIIAPINLGANMYSVNQKYVLASVLTWGNLYFASQKADFSLSDLDGADVIFFGEGTINDVIVKHVLAEKEITPANIQYLGSTALTQAQLLAKDDAIVLVAEPSLSAAKKTNTNINSISVQELYEEVSSNNSFPQAGCFINVETINNHKEVVDTFIDRLEDSANEANSDPEKVANLSQDLNLGTPAAVLKAAIPNCNIRFLKASSAKNAIEYVVALKPQIFGGANPVEDFYYV